MAGTKADRRGWGRTISAVVLVFVLTGVLAGLVWAWLAPSAAELADRPDIALRVDATYGLVAFGGGVLASLAASLRHRREGMALVVGVVVGSVLGAVAQLALGVLLGTPMVRAVPMLLAWPIGALIVVVSAGVTYGLGEDLPQPWDRSG